MRVHHRLVDFARDLFAERVVLLRPLHQRAHDVLFGGDPAEEVLLGSLIRFVVEDRRMTGVRDEVGHVLTVRHLARMRGSGVEHDERGPRSDLADNLVGDLADRAGRARPSRQRRPDRAHGRGRRNRRRQTDFRRWRPSSETSTWSTSKRDPFRLVARRTPILPPAPSNAIFGILLSSLASGLNAAVLHGAEEVGRSDLSALQCDLTLGMGRIDAKRATECAPGFGARSRRPTLVCSGCDQHHVAAHFS